MEPFCGRTDCAKPGRFFTMSTADTLRIMAAALCRY